MYIKQLHILNQNVLVKFLFKLQQRYPYKQAYKLPISNTTEHYIYQLLFKHKNS